MGSPIVWIFSILTWGTSVSMVQGLTAPDLQVQVGYYAADWAKYYKNFIWINGAKTFPSSGWEFSVEFEAYSMGHPDVNNTITNNLFQCFHICQKTHTGWRHNLKMDPSYITTANGCDTSIKGDTQYQPFCVLKADHANVAGLEPFVLGYFKDPADTDKADPSDWNDFSFVQPQSRVVGTSSFPVGGTFAGPAPMIHIPIGAEVSGEAQTIGATGDAGVDSAKDSKWTVVTSFYAKKVQQATCLGGYEFDSTACKACPPGKFRGIEFREGNLQCLSCPPFSGKSLVEQQIAGSVDPASCVCDAGYERSKTSNTSRGVLAPAGASDAFYCLRCLVGTYGFQEKCVDCSLGSFSDTEAMSECTRCGPGYFQNETKQEKCLPCAQGKSVGGTGQQSCVDCTPGRFASVVGKDRCDTCPVGKFTASKGAPGCDDCPALKTTAVSDSSSSADCKCMAGTYQDPTTGSCISCLEGMSCDGGNNLGLTVPLQKIGFQVHGDSAPFMVYKCVNENVCPAGPANVCNGGIDPKSKACSQCESDYYMYKGECLSCDGKIGLVMVIAILFVGIPVMCTCVYYFVNSPVTAKALPGLTLAVSLGMMLMLFQTLAVFGQIELQIDSPWGDILTFFDFFMFDFSMLRVQCVFSSTSMGMYVGRLIIPLVFGVWYFLCLIGSKGLCSVSKQWTFPKTVNTMCTLLQAVFISLVVSAVIPFNCYQHPAQTVADRPSSVAAYPDTICGEGDHPTMMGLGALAIIVYAGGFCGVCLILNFKAPAWSARSPLFLQYTRFLVGRFRPAQWYWGSILHIRSLAMAILPLFAPEVPTVQYMLIAAVLVFSILLQCTYQPWKTHELNVLDVVILTIALFLCLMSFALCPSTPDSTQTVFVILLTATFFGALFLIAVFFCWFVYLTVKGNTKEKKVAELSQFLYSTVQCMSGLPQDVQGKFIQGLTWWELQAVVDFIDVFGPCLETTRELKRKISIIRPETTEIRRSVRSTEGGKGSPDSGKKELKEAPDTNEAAI